jgi:polysaccharide export outer membrane protein
MTLNYRLFVQIVAVGTLVTGGPGALGPGQRSTLAAEVQAQAQAPSTVGGIAVSADFVVGPEDVLGILFWREADFSGDVTVRPDGRITLPLIGDIVAAGVTPVALRDQIQTAAATYLAEPNVTVVVRQINSRKVFITGQIGQPGAYALTGPRTVMQLISLAGGIGQFAKSENISILRQEQGRTRALSFNYKDVSLGRNV